MGASAPIFAFKDSMLLYIKRKNKRLPWHIAVGTLPLPISSYNLTSGYRKYAINTFCGHRVFGFVNDNEEDMYGSHHISETHPEHQLELCQNCVRLYESRTGQPFNFLQL
jgi:hypothetical protein